jgi:hypothetical protein
VLSLVGRGVGRPDRISVLLIDTDVALEEWHRAPRDREGWRLDVDRRIGDRGGVLARPEPEELPDVSAGLAYAQRLVGGRLKDALERAGHWDPYGAVEIDSPVSGLAVSIDGRVVGVLSTGKIRLERLLPGARRLVFEKSGAPPISIEIQVDRGETARVEAGQIAIASGSSADNTVRSGVAIAGIAAAAAGTAATIAAIISAQGPSRVDCVALTGPSPSCQSGFVALGERTASASGGNFMGSGSGVLAAPLGYGLIGLGAVWTLGAWLLTPRDQIPWLPLVAGVVFLGASYGLSAALSPHGSAPAR